MILVGTLFGFFSVILYTNGSLVNSLAPACVQPRAAHPPSRGAHRCLQLGQKQVQIRLASLDFSCQIC